MKVAEWDAERRKLKPAFANAGITCCELAPLRLAECFMGNMLTFAHAKKRRFLSPEENGVVILACVPCHNVIEAMSHEDMERIVMETIAKRAVQPQAFADDNGYEHTLSVLDDHVRILDSRKKGTEHTIYGVHRAFPQYRLNDRVLLVDGDKAGRFQITAIQRGDERNEFYFEFRSIETTGDTLPVAGLSLPPSETRAFAQN